MWLAAYFTSESNQASLFSLSCKENIGISFLPENLTDIQHDLSTGAFWEIVRKAVSGGDTSVTRFPVVNDWSSEPL